MNTTASRLLVCLSVCFLALGATVPAQAGFELNTSSKWLSISYDGIPVVDAVDVHFTNPGSWSKRHVLGTKKMKVARAGQASRIRYKGSAKRLGTYDLSVDCTEHRVRLHIRGELEPDAYVGHAITDLYLAKSLVENAKHTPALAGKLIVPVSGVSFATYIGRLDCELTSGVVRPAKHAPPSNWTFRDTRGHRYRPPFQRTWSLLNSINLDKAEAARQAGLVYEATATLTMTPARHIEEAVLANGLSCALDRAADRYPRAVSMPGTARELKILRERLAAFLQGAGGAGSEAAARTFVSAAMRDTGCLLSDCLAHDARRKSEVFIIPQPQKMALANGSFAVDSRVVVLVPASARPEELRGANALVAELEQYWGITLRILRGDTPPPGKRCIVIGRGGRSPYIRRLCEQAGVEVTPRKPGPEGYVLQITPNRVAIVGSDDRGAFYGVQSLLQVLRRTGAGRVEAPCLAVEDWPETAMRGLWLLPGMHGKNGLAYMKKAIARVMARYKFNTLLLGEGNSGFIRWKSHPEICNYKAAWTPEMLKDCVDYAKDHFLEVIPSIQSLSHTKSVAKAHPELEEEWGCLCPSNPDLYKLLEDLYTEAIEIYEPKYFHIGLDEIGQIGVCERCKGTPADELLTRHVTRLHGWLKARGIKTMMAHDMLLEAKRWPNSSAHSQKNKTGGFSLATHPAAQKLPRDVIQIVWIYGDQKKFPALKHFQDLGYPVVGSPWWRDKNNYNLTQYSHEHGALGVIGTSWMFNSHAQSCMTSILPAENSWTPGRPKLKDLPYASVERLHNGMFAPRPSQRGLACRPIDIRARCNRALHDVREGDARGWADQGPLRDLRLFPTGRQRFAGVPFLVPPGTTNGGRQCIGVAGKDMKKVGLPTAVSNIRINGKAESLVFLHTCVLDEFQVNLHLADYVVRYADGTERTVPVKGWRQIVPARKPPVSKTNYEPLNAGYIQNASRAWVGMNLGGEEIDVQAFEWVNKYPEKPITDVELRMAAHNKKAAVFLLGLTAVRPGSAGMADVPAGR